MKASKYNTFAELDDGSVLVFNALSGVFARMGKNTYNDYLKIINIPDNTRESLDICLLKTTDRLIELNIIVNDRVSEFDIVRAQYNAYGRYNNTPAQVIIYPTLSCNYRCSYCVQGDIKEAYVMSRETEDRVIEFTKKFISEYSFIQIGFSGGEITLALDTTCRLAGKIYKILREQKKKYNIGIATNGYLFTKDTAARLKENGVNDIAVSLDGPPRIHDKRRVLANGKGTFETVLNNIKDAAGLVNIYVLTCLDKENAQAYPELLDILEAEGLKGKVTLRLDHMHECNWHDKEYGKCMSFEEYSEALHKINIEIANRGFAEYETPFACTYGVCTGIRWNSIVVAPNGELYKCQSLVGNKNECVGHIMNPANSLNPKLLKWFAWDPYSDKKCRECSILPLCNGGCPLNELSKDWQVSPYNMKRICVRYKHTFSENLKFFYKNMKEGRKIEIIQL